MYFKTTSGMAAMIFSVLAIGVGHCQMLDGGSVSKLEIFRLCFPRHEGCSAPIAAIHREGGDALTFSTESNPLFLTKHPVRWTLCTRFDEQHICLTLDDNDLAAWNALHASNERATLGFVVNKKIISIIGSRGPAVNPIVIGEPDGDQPPSALISFLRASASD